MTIDEAIKHCEEVADTPCFTDEEARCYSEHRQLAEWLKELKEYKEQSGDEELDFVPEHKKIPCTMIIGKPCEDAISRQAVLDAMYDLCDTGETLKENPWRDNPHIDAIIETIDDLPSVTPQQRAGRWIIKDGKEQGYDIAGVKTWYIQIMCDKCGFIKTAIEGHIGEYKFCPKCGQPKM